MSWREPTEREDRAAAWERRRHELLNPDHQDWRRASQQGVAAALGLSVRTLQRYEHDGAPGWYELALIGLAHARRRGSTEP
jgi:hypothetical protein